MTRDIHQEVTDKIIAKLEDGALPWRKDWTSAKGAGAFAMPRRANGEFYKGINVLLLWLSADAQGFHADQWMTFKQAKALGGKVRKGEKGTGIVFYKTLEIEDENGEDRKIPMARGYTVFNVQQIDNLPADYAPADLVAEPGDDFDSGARPIADFEDFFGAIGANIQIDGQDPHYRPASDSIHMPPVTRFDSAAAYYGTLAHELIHWTGHKSRLDRDKKYHTTEGRAFEELIAELGACFVTSTHGGAPDLDNSAAYLGSWLRALKNDKKFIFRAAAAAQKAADFLDAAAAAGSVQIAA